MGNIPEQVRAEGLIINIICFRFELPVLEEIVGAAPTAELEPLSGQQVVQTDEQDMGMTYAELGQYGRLRKQLHCGPFSMFCKLTQTWSPECTPAEVSQAIQNSILKMRD